jgi:hypothetical protein
MNRLSTATRTICSWRERLASPERHWKRTYSAFEAAVSWEFAASTDSGLPAPIHELLESAYGSPKLLLAVAEHKVCLPGGNADSQNDVWALVETAIGCASVCIEAKARERFGDESLGAWLKAGKSEQARRNREARWQYLREHLPVAPDGAYSPVAYQLLHRCASSIIEARRFKLKHAACIVQAFNTPADRFAEFADFCRVLGMTAARGAIERTPVADVQLAIGWADCPLATDAQIAAVV